MGRSDPSFKESDEMHKQIKKPHTRQEAEVLQGLWVDTRSKEVNLEGAGHVEDRSVNDIKIKIGEIGDPRFFRSSSRK